MSQKAKVLAALQSGQELTNKLITAKFKVKNARALISHLRADGYCVYGNTKVNSKGQKTLVFRIGKPNRAMIAAAYSVLGSSAL